MMQRVNVNGVELESETHGSGEPVVLIHGSAIADTYLPMMGEPSLSAFRLLRYRRRGFGASTHPQPPVSIPDQAADCMALMRRLGVSRAHVVGHSYGGAIAIQLALDFPDALQSLVLLEPALMGAVPDNGEFLQGFVTGPLAEYRKGDKRGAMALFLELVGGPNWRRIIDSLAGAFEMAVADADNFFMVESPAIQEWSFTRQDAARIRQPVLAVVGADTIRIFHDVHKLVLSWFPQAQPFELAKAGHFLQMENPRPLSEAIARFLREHPIGGEKPA
ncbi:MAG: alpha/beta hydrolase [Candidatus Binataceae bacterium]